VYDVLDYLDSVGGVSPGFQSCGSQRRGQMINFRRAICRSCRKGSFFYGLLDCARYLPAPPIPPVEPPIEPPDDPITWEERKICSVSFGVPGEWCLDQKTVTVPVGSPYPLPCHCHTAPRIPVYVGAYDLMGATGDWKSFLRKCKSAGATGVRFFICYSWQGPQPTSPYKQVGTWKHENGDTFPLYRLIEWNKEFWDKLDDVLNNMRELDLTPWLVCEDFCSLKGDQHVKYFNPFYGSEEALSPATPGGVWGESMDKYHKALADRFTHYRDIVELANEYDIVDGSDEDYINWYWRNSRDINVNVFLATSGARVNRLGMRSRDELYSPHGIGTAIQIEGMYGIPPAKMIWSSDGFWQGQGHADAKGRRGVGIDEARKIGARVKEIGGAFELLPRELYRDNNDRAELSNFDPAVIEAMARG
jgi:hypothetical protein